MIGDVRLELLFLLRMKNRWLICLMVIQNFPSPVLFAPAQRVGR